MSRCIECKRPLLPSEQGALCNPCYFEAITNPDVSETAWKPQPLGGIVADDGNPRPIHAQTPD